VFHENVQRRTTNLRWPAALPGARLVSMKKIRFGDLVRKSGRPSTMELWIPPEKNKELQRAIRANRVLTIKRGDVGRQRDVGEIGFRKQPGALYLIFPRALPVADGSVIGINYDLLDQPA